MHNTCRYAFYFLNDTRILIYLEIYDVAHSSLMTETMSSCITKFASLS